MINFAFAFTESIYLKHVVICRLRLKYFAHMQFSQ